MRALKSFIYGILVIVALFLIMAIAKYTSPTAGQNQGQTVINVEKELKILAVRFINAEYSGDIDQLLEMSKSDANMSIRNGEHILPTNNKLEKIISYNFISTGTNDTWEVIIAISDSTPEGETQPIYYEHLWFEKIENSWYVVRIGRDA